MARPKRLPLGREAPPRPKMGRPKIAQEVEADVRRRILRGDSSSMIIDALGVGTSVVTRIRKDVSAEQTGEKRTALVELAKAAIRGGMSPKHAMSLIAETTGIELHMRGGEIQ